MVEYRQALPAGFVLAGDYRINGVLGQGGFGITYKAEDLRLGAPVAIKEYFPSELAVRDGGSTVEPRSVRDEHVLEWGRVKFLEEARTLARFRHPSIVRVSRLFEANNTAYMVLDFEMGPSLAEWRVELGREPTQAEVDRIAAKLLDAVGAVHDAGILHRDIKPANVIMRDRTEPVLIDFGAARQALSAQSKTVHAIVTPGYSPKEQYAVDLDRQGPWSDIYALGATLYFLVTGRPPPDALSRELGEEMKTAASARGPWRSDFLAAVDRAMSLNSEARPQSMAEWREMLFAASPSLASRDQRRGQASTIVARASSRAMPSAALLSESAVGPSAPRRLSFDDLPRAGATAATKSNRSRAGVLLGSMLTGVLLLGGLGYWILVEAPARDEAAWLRALSANTVAAYERYVADQPSGRHVPEARKRQTEIREFAQAAASGTAARSDALASAGAAASRDGPATPVARSEPSVEAAAPAVDGNGTGPPQGPTGASTEPPSEPPATRVASNAPVAAPTATPPAVDPSPGPTSPAPPSSAPQPLASRDPGTTSRADASPPQAAARQEPVPQREEAPAATPSAVSSGPFGARPALPPAASQDEIARIAASVPAGQWRFAVDGVGADRAPGFTDQSGDFVAELKRLSADKLDFTPIAANRAIPSGELLQRLATNRDLVAWQPPLAHAGRHLEFAIFSGAVPFGLTPNDHVRWLRAEGAQLLEQTFNETGTPLRAVPCGIAGGVGAWFKKEVRSPSDFRGLKVRAPRIMAETLGKLGATTVTLQSNRELAAAFTANRIDANFDATPLTEIFLAQSRPASVYHYPGVHNPAYLFTLLIGPDAWSAMPDLQRRAIDEACRRNLARWAQHFPSTQSDVLNQIRRQRIVVRPFTGPLRESLRKAVDEVLAEEAARRPRFKEILESYNRFRS